MPWPEALERGHAVFVLHGSKLRGGYALQRTGTGERSGCWSSAATRRPGRARMSSREEPASVISGRTLDELLAE